MNLFELAQRQMKRIAGVVATIQGSKPAGAVVQNISIPLLQYSIGKDKGLQPGESHSFEGVDMPVSKQPDGLINIEHVRGGITDFVNSVLLFAHNPVRRVQHGAPPERNVTVESPESDTNEFHLHFAKIGPEKYDPRPIFQNIENLEVAMFSDWKPRTPKSKDLIKTFPTAEEAGRVAHLLMCMGNALGFSDEQISGAFSTAPNDHSLVVHEDFMSTLAQVEKSEVASFGRRRTG